MQVEAAEALAATKAADQASAQEQLGGLERGLEQRSQELQAAEDEVHLRRTACMTQSIQLQGACMGYFPQSCNVQQSNIFGTAAY